ncbi:MAG: glycosyltransferase [Candidatus Omnitrophica bacterium]|nr:glycosyltransferase [Candidatus Omnitrophota bacterium]
MFKEQVSGKKIRVAFIGQKGIPANFGGIESYVEGVAERLCKDGYEVSVYVRGWYTKKGLKNYKGIKLIHIPSIKNKYFDAFSHVLFCSIYSISRNFDLIHYQGIGPSFFCWIPRLFGKKVVLTVHSLPQKSTKWKPFAKWFLRLSEIVGMISAHKVIAVSKDLKCYLEKKYKKGVSYISNAVSLEGGYAVPEVIKKKHNLRSKKYILYLGRITPEKRIEWIIKAFRDLANGGFFEKNSLESLKLIIAGAVNASDKYEILIKNMIGSDGRIILSKWVGGREKEELLNNACLFVLPSYLEGLPMVLLEAMRYELPVLVSDIPSHMEVVEDNKDGFLFSNNSFESFLRRLKEILDLESEKLSLIGKKAQEKIKEGYGLSTKVAMIEEIYQSLFTMNTEPSAKICFVCNPGGHLYQLYLLKPFWQKYERFWVTADKIDARYRLAGEKIYWGYCPTTRNLKNFLLNLILAFRVLGKERPRIIVSTGSGVAVPFFWVGKLFGCKLVYIEVFDRIDMPTLSGKLIYSVADEFLLQWQEQKKFYPKAKVLGQML